MSDFWGDINTAKINQHFKNLDIQNEITKSIGDRVKSQDFEEWLKNKIINAIQRNKHNYEIEVAFWDYNAGCSETHFYIGPYYWNNGNTGYESRKYQDMYLYEIKREVVAELRKILEERLDDLQVKYSVRDETRPHLDYPKFIYTLNF